MFFIIAGKLIVLILAINDGQESKKDTEEGACKLRDNHEDKRKQVLAELLLSQEHANGNSWVEVATADVVGNEHHDDCDLLSGGGGIQAEISVAKYEGVHDESGSEELIHEHSDFLIFVFGLHYQFKPQGYYYKPNSHSIQYNSNQS